MKTFTNKRCNCFRAISSSELQFLVIRVCVWHFWSCAFRFVAFLHVTINSVLEPRQSRLWPFQGVPAFLMRLISSLDDQTKLSSGHFGRSGGRQLFGEPGRDCDSCNDHEHGWDIQWKYQEIMRIVTRCDPVWCWHRTRQDSVLLTN